MIVIRDTTGITVKRRADDMDHVRIGVTQISYWKEGVSIWLGQPIGKPHSSFTLEELENLLERLERR